MAQALRWWVMLIELQGPTGTPKHRADIGTLHSFRLRCPAGREDGSSVVALFIFSIPRKRTPCFYSQSIYQNTQFSPFYLAWLTHRNLLLPRVWHIFHRRLSVPFGHVSFWHCNSHSRLRRVQQPKLVASHGMKKLRSSRIWHLRKCKVNFFRKSRSIERYLEEPVNPTTSTCQALHLSAQNCVPLQNPSGKELAKIIHRAEIKASSIWAM